MPLIVVCSAPCANSALVIAAVSSDNCGTDCGRTGFRPMRPKEPHSGPSWGGAMAADCGRTSSRLTHPKEPHGASFRSGGKKRFPQYRHRLCFSNAPHCHDAACATSLSLPAGCGAGVHCGDGFLCVAGGDSGRRLRVELGWIAMYGPRSSPGWKLLLTAPPPFTVPPSPIFGRFAGFAHFRAPLHFPSTPKPAAGSLRSRY